METSSEDILHQSGPRPLRENVKFTLRGKRIQEGWGKERARPAAVYTRVFLPPRGIHPGLLAHTWIGR